MAFISIVGNQIMAVLNPLMVLMENSMLPENVFLLHTVSGSGVKSKSQLNAEKIASWLKKSTKHPNVELIPISNYLTIDANNNPPVQEKVMELSNKYERVIFNLAGGMNFQVAACVQKLDLKKTNFYYPQSLGIQSIRITDSGADCKIMRLKNSPGVIEVLNIQGVPYTIINNSNRRGSMSVLKEFFTKCFGKDDKSISGWYEKNVQVKDVLFDRVYNNGHELIFMIATNYNDNVESIRNIINLSNNRRDLGEILHDKIVVITDVPDFAERLKTESQGKITIINPKDSNSCDTIKKMFRVHASEKVTTLPQAESLKIEKTVRNESVLYLALGRELMPSLIALYSHAPKKACFIYTPDNELVLSYKNNLLSNLSLLPCEELVFIPVGIDGIEILNYTPDTNNNIEVNITPGTKGHTAFLSLFAAMHNGSVWSISDKIMSIGAYNQEKDIVAPEIKSYLTIRGLNSKSKDYDKRNDWHCKGLLQFLGFLKTDNRLEDFPGNEIKLENGWSYSISQRDASNKPINGCIIYGSQKFRVPLKKDAWFECIIAYMLNSAGADEIKLNLTIPWSDTTQKIIFDRLEKKAKHPKKPLAVQKIHRTEVDIVARFGSNFYIISCKSGQNVQKKKAIAELKGVAPVFGRFAFPLLVSLKHKGEPQKIDGVYVAGYDTFSDVAKFRELLKTIKKESRTTEY